MCHVPPKCQGTRCRLCRCAASGPSSPSSLTGFPPTSVTTAGASRLAPLHMSPIRPSRCRRLADLDTKIPSGRSVRTPTRSRPGLHSFLHRSCTTLYSGLFQLVPHCSAACLYLILLVCFTSRLCHGRIRKLIAGLFDFRPCAGYASASLPRPLSGAAGLTGESTLFPHFAPVPSPPVNSCAG